ncbi:alpha/beta fold hydrolase [Promicromonospora soli]|nr:alpha/beta hydrolase [Promicromonospora soli]
MTPSSWKASRMGRRAEDELGVTHTWGAGPEVIFLSNPLADPVEWSASVRDELLALGYRVTTFEHRPSGLDWRSSVTCVEAFLARRREPVALVGWSQGAAIAQEVALAAPERVRVAALLATYGRQNEIDRVLQECWDILADGGSDSVRLAMGLLTAFSPDRLADDSFVRNLREAQSSWAGPPEPRARRRSATFISTYQDRLQDLAGVTVPCLIMGFELDTDTFVSRAREVARAIPRGEYVELPGLGHAAPFSDPDLVWPRVIGFLKEHHPPA